MIYDDLQKIASMGDNTPGKQYLRKTASAKPGWGTALKAILKKNAPAIGLGVGLYAIPAALGAGADAIKTVYKEHQAEQAFEEAMKRIMEDEDIMVTPENQRNAEKFFASIKRFAPELAADPNLLEMYIKNVMDVPNTIPQQVLQAIDARKRLLEPSLAQRKVFNDVAIGKLMPTRAIGEYVDV